MIKASGGVAAIRKMAAGKKRVDNFQWQIQVSNNEEWEELLQRKGLVVIDVYQEWCGPCMAMAGHLKEIKLQLGDDLLQCALAKADSIDQLEKFRGRSEPMWLFLASGELVDFVKGANAPLIRQTIVNELEQEKRVMADLHPRNTISWDSIEFPAEIPPIEEEEDGGNGVESDPVIPLDWDKMDAILLKGPYRTVLDEIQQRFAEISLEIVHTSEVILRDEESTSMILWITSDPDEDEAFIESVDNIVKEAIHNSLNENHNDDADAGVEEEQKEGEEPKEEEQQPEVEEPNREEEAAEAEEEPEDKIAAIVQYQLLFDAKEVEELVHRCQPADGVETLDGDEDAPVDDEEVHQEVEEVITQEETENADKGPDVV